MKEVEISSYLLNKMENCGLEGKMQPQQLRRGPTLWIRVGTFFLIALVGAYFWFQMPNSQHRALIGKPAPDLDLESLSGEKVKLTGFIGAVVLINFWASWCPPCMEEMPSLRDLEDTLEGKPFRLLAVNVGEDSRETMKSLRGPQFPKNQFSLVGEAGLDSYSIGVLPLSLLIDKVGRVQRVFVGPREWANLKILKEIQNLIDE